MWLQLVGLVALALVGSEIGTLDHTLCCIRAGFGSVLPAVGRMLSGTSRQLILLALATSTTGGCDRSAAAERRSTQVVTEGHATRVG